MKALDNLREFVAYSDKFGGFPVYHQLADYDARELLRLIDLLVEEVEDMVAQNCTMPDKSLDSCGLSAHADAIRLLVDLGKLEPVGDYGRRVIARWPTPPPPPDTAPPKDQTPR